MKSINNISIFIMFVLVLACTICGCSSGSKQMSIEFRSLDAFEIGGFDDTDGGVHTSDYPLWSSENRSYHQDVSAKQSVSVEFNGVTYSGEYLYSAVWLPNTYLSHKYDGDKMYFEVNADTGALCSIMFAYEPSENATISEADCKKIADAIADDYVSLSDYKVDVTRSEIYDNFICTYKYYREVSGYKTSDYLTVSIDGNGGVTSFRTYMLGSFENVGKVSLNKNEEKVAIENKLATIYANSTTRKGYTVDNVVLVKLDDDSFGFLYTISNEFVYGDVRLGSQLYLLLKNKN